MNHSNLREHLVDTLLQDSISATAELNEQGKIQKLEGDFEHFGLNPQLNGDASSSFDFIAGLLPLEQNLHLPYWNYAESAYADIHLVPSEQGVQLLLLDNTKAGIMQQELQQVYSELELSQLLTPSLFKPLMRQLDFAVLEFKNDALRLLGEAPSWLKHHDSPYWDVQEASFLAHFLLDAKAFWDKGANTEKIRSGLWTETSESAEHNFEATALFAQNRPLMVIEKFCGSKLDLVNQLQAHRALSFKEQNTSSEERRALEKNNDALTSLAYFDDLTGLYNQRAFKELATRELKLAKRTNSPILLFYFDLDNFKIINDTQGHAAGDSALKKMAEAFKQVFRSTDIIGRLGGDEFAVLVSNANAKNSKTVIERFEALLAQYHKQDDVAFPLFASIGIAHYESDKEQSIDDLLKLADARMYREKREKRQNTQLSALKPKTQSNLNTKTIRRLLADAREKKQAAQSKMLNVQWSRSAYLVSAHRFEELINYLEQTKDTFSLNYDADKKQLFLFEVNVIIDKMKADNSLAELVLVLPQKKAKIRRS